MNNDRMCSVAEQDRCRRPILAIDAEHINPRDYWPFGIWLHHNTLSSVKTPIGANLHRRATGGKYRWRSVLFSLSDNLGDPFRQRISPHFTRTGQPART